MARKKIRYFEDPTTGRFWQVELFPGTIWTWEGAIGENVPATATNLKQVTLAEEEYDRLVERHLRSGYREMPKPKRVKKPRARKKPIPKQWDDELFGLLHRVKGTTGLWERKISLKFLGQTLDVRISVNAEYADGLSRPQQQAYTKFMEQPALLREAEQKLLKYYRSICRDLRDQFGEFRDEWAPIVRSMKQFSRIVTLTDLYFPSHGRSRTMGLLLDCTWDESHGLAVKFVNEKLKEIGNQDIIL